MKDLGKLLQGEDKSNLPAVIENLSVAELENFDIEGHFTEVRIASQRRERRKLYRELGLGVASTVISPFLTLPVIGGAIARYKNRHRSEGIFIGILPYIILSAPIVYSYVNYPGMRTFEETISYDSGSDTTLVANMSLGVDNLIFPFTLLYDDLDFGGLSIRTNDGSRCDFRNYGPWDEIRVEDDGRRLVKSPPGEVFASESRWARDHGDSNNLTSSDVYRTEEGLEKQCTAALDSHTESPEIREDILGRF